MQNEYKRAGIDEIKAAAKGQWREILLSLGIPPLNI